MPPPAEAPAVAGSPWLPEYFGQEIFSTIHRLQESPHEQGD